MGQVTHVLLTRSRLCPGPKPGSSLHLHVLSTPPAFVLSQDQTLREELLPYGPEDARRHVELVMELLAVRVHTSTTFMTGHSISGPPSPAKGRWIEPGRTHRAGKPRGAHAVEFSKTAAPCREGDSFGWGATGHEERPDGDRRV